MAVSSWPTMKPKVTTMRIWSEAFADICRPISRLTGSEWADKYRVVPPGTSPEPGPWRSERTPYAIEPVNACTDRETETVVLMFSSQLGKSELLLNVIGYYASQEPAPQLMLQPTVEMAEAFSKERISPMFEYSPGLKGKLEEGKDGRGTAKKSSTTIRMKHYSGGYLALVGANSPAGLASRPIRILLCDEIDRYPASTKEGDPIKLAIQRSANFEASRKIILVSTPTTTETSKINEYFERSDKRYYFVPCPHCEEFHVLKWENVRWEKGPDGQHLPETAAMYCPHCGSKIRGNGRPNLDMLMKGKWVPTAESKIRGYQCSALYSPWVSLEALVTEFLACKKLADEGNRDALMEFVNLKLGEPWEHKAKDGGAWEALFDRREMYTEDAIPDGVLVITAGVDVQRDRVECSVYGWGEGFECWALGHHIVAGRPDDEETWAQLDAVLLKTYRRKSGQELRIISACVDSGDGMFTQDVYRFTHPRTRRRIYSVKGRSGSVPFTSKHTRAGSMNAVLFTLGVDSGKRLVMDRLGVESPGPGYVHFTAAAGAGLTEEYFKQLLSEDLVVKIENAGKKLVWVKNRDRNEALDCLVYATAALSILRPNFEYLRSRLEGRPQESALRPTPQAPARRGVLSRGISL